MALINARLDDVFCYVLHVSCCVLYVVFYPILQRSAIGVLQDDVRCAAEKLFHPLLM